MEGQDKYPVVVYQTWRQNCKERTTIQFNRNDCTIVWINSLLMRRGTSITLDVAAEDKERFICWVTSLEHNVFNTGEYSSINFIGAELRVSSMLEEYSEDKINITICCNGKQDEFTMYNITTCYTHNSNETGDDVELEMSNSGMKKFILDNSVIDLFKEEKHNEEQCS